MKKILLLMIVLISQSIMAKDLIPKSFSCPIYELRDDSTEFDTSLQSVSDGDEDYAWLGMNRETNSVIIGYSGRTYPENNKDFKVSVRTSGNMAYAVIKGRDNNFMMSYDHSNGCIELSHAYTDRISRELVSGNIIAQGRCGRSKNLEACNEQTNIQF